MFNSYKFELKEKNNNGILVPLEENLNVPFKIKRIFYTYNIPSNEIRGNHAYHETRQVIICISGNVKIKCFDGKEEKLYELKDPSQGVYIDPKIWRTTYNHSSDCVLLILSSHEYNEDDYIRDYDEFMGEVRCI